MKSLEKILITLILVLFVSGMVYLASAFAEWDWNPGNWHWVTRAFMFFAVILMMVVVFVDEQCK